MISKAGNSPETACMNVACSWKMQAWMQVRNRPHAQCSALIICAVWKKTHSISTFEKGFRFIFHLLVFQDCPGPCLFQAHGLWNCPGFSRPESRNWAKRP